MNIEIIERYRYLHSIRVIKAAESINRYIYERFLLRDRTSRTEYRCYCLFFCTTTQTAEETVHATLSSGEKLAAGRWVARVSRPERGTSGRHETARPRAPSVPPTITPCQAAVTVPRTVIHFGKCSLDVFIFVFGNESLAMKHSLLKRRKCLTDYVFVNSTKNPMDSSNGMTKPLYRIPTVP